MSRNDVLSDNVLLLSEWLQQQGYTTGFITTNPNVGKVEQVALKEGGEVAVIAGAT